MLRAGHTLDNARQIVEASDLAVVEEWAESAIDGEFDGDDICE
jgi:hypothetical protein